MTVTLEYTTKVIISFDHLFETSFAFNPNLSTAIDFAKLAMLNHNFSVADIIDAETGEILAIVKK